MTAPLSQDLRKRLVRATAASRPAATSAPRTTAYQDESPQTAGANADRGRAPPLLLRP
jgi:hypothetical protein